MKLLPPRLPVLLALLAADFCLAGEDISCPATVRLGAGTIAAADVPDGYVPFVPDTTIRLTGVSVFDGPAEDGAILMPAPSSNARVARWIFEGAYEGGKWVSCDYAQGIVRLVKRLLEPTSSCTATLTKTKPHNTLAATFVCD